MNKDERRFELVRYWWSKAEELSSIWNTDIRLTFNIIWNIAYVLT